MSELGDGLHAAPPQRELELRQLLEAIHATYHYDFREYSMSSIARRVAQALLRLDCATVPRLQERILHEPRAFTALLQYLTVQVSEMFRDPPYFLALRERVLPLLATQPALKIWVAGCSTGEEAYSLAILLHELGLLERSLIYATDIHTESLRRAEAGVYALDRLATFSESHRASGASVSLSEYYTAAYGAATFDRALRNKIVFSDHSLASDGVFAQVQLISCRNVLIYFDRSLQDRVLRLFAEALPSGGFLGLGTRESVRNAGGAALFAAFSRGERIYRRV